MIQIIVQAQKASCRKSSGERITTGMVGKKVSFDFSAEWDGLVKTAVFEGSGVKKDVTLSGDTAVIPHECLTAPGGMLRVGVFGTDGTIQTPTVYTDIGQIEQGADPSGDTSADPTLPIWAQLQAMIGDLSNLTTTARDNLVAAINEAAKSGGGGGGTAADVRMQVAEGYIQYSTDGGTTWRNLIAMKDLIGKEGIGIQSVEQTTTSTEDGGTNVVTVKKTDGTTSTFSVKNGSKGSTGKTPNIQIGTVETLESGSNATASISGTAEAPLLNLGIPKGETGGSSGGGAGIVIDSTLTKAGQAADAAAVGNRLSALSEEIVTTSESKVAAHNTGADTHSDIRLLIQGLTDRLNALADSDDTTLDQLSEVVSYIKSNRSLIEAITTSKVSVADIVDDLTTNVSNKPLSAAQGVALKALIDVITVPDKLPNPNALTFTGAVTGSYDGSEPLTVNIPISGGGSGGSGGLPNWRLIKTLAFSSEIASITFSEDDNGDAFAVKEIMIVGTAPALEGNGYLYCRPSSAGNVGNNSLWPTAGKAMRWWLASVDGALKTMLAVSNTAVVWPMDKNISCPSDIVKICIGASSGVTADGTLYVYGR